MNNAMDFTVRNRSFHKRPGKLLLGPTGARLWMDYLEPSPGFEGRADFIHKQNIPLLFTVRKQGQDSRLEPMRADWKPAELLCTYEDSELSFTERKTITWQDQALSLQTWHNKSRRPLTLELVLPEGMTPGVPQTLPCHNHGLNIFLCVEKGRSWTGNTLTIAPGETRAFLLGAAAGLTGEEPSAAASLRALLDTEDPAAVLDAARDAYLSWYDQMPIFRCSDAFMERCWLYRFYILRKNMALPGTGRLPYLTFYEGRSHAMAKTPYFAKGWEFPRLIPLSTPLQVMDARWLHDTACVKEALRALTCTLDENGIFAVTATDISFKEYANFSGWALYQLYLVDPDQDFIRDVLPAFKQDVRSTYERMHENDALQVEHVHALTGKEYQPSYWFFTKQCFPTKVRPAQEGYTPLKRVDRSVYVYLNLLGLSRLCRAIGDADADDLAATAEKLRQDILNKMWDPVSHCFYDLHHETDEKAFVKNIVAYYPFWAEITGEEHLPQFDYLFSEQYFATGSGFASAAADCPVFSSDGGWRGDYFKGRNGCLWNGPSWPYTTGIVLDAVARQSKKHGHRYDREFAKYLHEYTLEHFRFGDIDQPYLVEFYDSRTGEPLSDEPDYNHSFYVDLIVQHLAGLSPTEDGIRFAPLHTDLRYFSLENLCIRGHRIDLYFQQEEGEHWPEKGAGYTLLIDGKLRFTGLMEDECIFK